MRSRVGAHAPRTLVVHAPGRYGERMTFITWSAGRLVGLAAIATLAAACADEKDAADYPVLPSSTVGGGTGDDSLRTISGRVCVIDDLRAPATCGLRAAGALTVTSGTTSATTDDDGVFAITVPRFQNELTVTGNQITPTTIGIRPDGTADLVPAVDADVFARMQSANNLVLDPGTGSILTTITDNGLPAPGIVVSSTPASPFGTFFDTDGSPLVWGINGTGSRGVAWIPGVVAGTYDLRFDRILGGNSTLVGGVSVRNGGITILDTSLVGGPGLPNP